jgi:hypothetical protein
MWYLTFSEVKKDGAMSKNGVLGFYITKIHKNTLLNV